jgi:hypothetical protein
MAVEAISALSAGGAKAGPAGAKIVDLSPDNSVSHNASASPHLQVKFSNAVDKSAHAIAPASSSNMPSPVKGMFDALDQINTRAKSVSEYASTAEASGGQLTPGEIVQLTMKCQEFMFQCQLTSNIANRSSDGVQQLFRQQG